MHSLPTEKKPLINRKTREIAIRLRGRIKDEQDTVHRCSGCAGEHNADAEDELVAAQTIEDHTEDARTDKAGCNHEDTSPA
jgi:hypothetical protein